MIEISLRFLTGRYHATAWGRHVNEGAVEWPPSPWRILRALVATWKRKLPELRQNQVEAVLRALVVPPEFLLPPAVTGHTRHYMPWFKKGPDDKTLVFDTFVAVARNSEVIARWPDVELDRDQRKTLARILENLNTLGRAESWCEATLRDSDEQRSALSDALRCFPLARGDQSSNHETVRLLCLDPVTAFSDEHVAEIERRTTGRGKNKQTVEERSTVYDPAWNLCIDTLQLHRDRRYDPPGSQWIPYIRPRDCFKIEHKGTLRRRATGPRFHVAHFAIDSVVLPLITETLPVAESTRRNLIRLYTDVRGRREYGQDWSHETHRFNRDQTVPPSRVFSGKDELGQPLRGNRHAYYLATDEDGDGRLDHLTIYSVDGFGEHEISALDRLRAVSSERHRGASRELRVLLLGMGMIGDYEPGPLRPSYEWVSTTPYVAARYAKTRGRSRIEIRSPEDVAAFLAGDLRAQLAAVRPEFVSDGAVSVLIEPLWDGNHVFKIAKRWRPIQFKRARRGKGDGGSQRLAGAFRITFPQPVSGPIALGYSSHFGLGQFRPVFR